MPTPHVLELTDLELTFLELTDLELTFLELADLELMALEVVLEPARPRRPRACSAFVRHLADSFRRNVPNGTSAHTTHELR